MGLRRLTHDFIFWAILVLIVKDMKRVSRLRVVVFDVAIMLLITELEAATGLTDIFLITGYAR
jgi:hypothetical protein